jgi:hypothetical protein
MEATMNRALFASCPIVGVVGVVALANLAGCTNQMGPAVTLGKGLPIARLSCPSHVDKGANIHVDGSGSGDDGSLVTQDLRIGTLDGAVHDEASGLEADFVVDRDLVVTVTLHVIDDANNEAFAACRVIVGDVSAADIAPDDEEDDDGVDEDPVDGGDDHGAPRAPGTPVDIDGNFALVAWDAAQVSTFGLEPGTQCAPAKSVSLVTVHQTGTHVALSMKTCSISLPAVDSWIGRQISSFSDAAIRAMPSLTAEFDLPYAEVGDPFTAVTAPTGMVLGADVADGEPLPTDSTLTNVIDSDGDGRPGVNMHTIDGDGELVDDHAVVYRRAVAAFAGTVVSDDEIDGSAPGAWQVNGETALLDDWADLLTPDAVGLPSTFKMTRTAALRCSDLSDLDALPAPPPPDLGGCYVAQ